MTADEVTTAAELDALPQQFRYSVDVYGERVACAAATALLAMTDGGNDRLPTGDLRYLALTAAQALNRPDRPVPQVDREVLIEALADSLMRQVRTVLDTARAGMPSDAALREPSGVAAECERRVVYELKHGGGLDDVAFDAVIRRVLAARGDAASAAQPVTVTAEDRPWEHEGHNPVQHRDRKPPWCHSCGWSSPIAAVPAQMCSALGIEATR